MHVRTHVYRPARRNDKPNSANPLSTVIKLVTDPRHRDLFILPKSSVYRFSFVLRRRNEHKGSKKIENQIEIYLKHIVWIVSNLDNFKTIEALFYFVISVFFPSFQMLQKNWRFLQNLTDSSAVCNFIIVIF